jgi:hypothetical protein
MRHPQITIEICRIKSKIAYFYKLLNRIIDAVGILLIWIISDIKINTEWKTHHGIGRGVNPTY